MLIYYTIVLYLYPRYMNLNRMSPKSQKVTLDKLQSVHRLLFKQVCIPDRNDCPCSLKVFCHGSLNPTPDVRPVCLWFREAEWLQTHITSKGPNGRADTCPLTLILLLLFFIIFFFICYRAHAHFTLQGQLLSRAAVAPLFSKCGLKTHRQVACEACLSSMATVEWSVWKASATPAWPLCRRARLCRTSTLAHTQQ